MKRLIIILSLISLTGCAYLQKWTDAQAWCASNQECLQDTKKYAEVGKQVGSAVVPAGGMVAGGVLTYLLLGIFGLKRKPKENQ